MIRVIVLPPDLQFAIFHRQVFRAVVTHHRMVFQGELLDLLRHQFPKNLHRSHELRRCQVLFGKHQHRVSSKPFIQFRLGLLIDRLGEIQALHTGHKILTQSLYLHVHGFR